MNCNPRVVGHASREVARGDAVIFQQPVTVVRRVILFHVGDFEVLVSGILDSRLGEDVVRILVEVEGSIQPGDDGELAELLGQDAGAVR